MNDRGISVHLREAALAMLREAVGSAATVDSAQASPGWDAVIRRQGCEPIRLTLRNWEAAAEPAIAQGRVWVLSRPRKTELKRLRERGENFVALNGAVRMVDDWLLLDRTDLAPRGKQPPLPRRIDPFADRNSLIARALLAHPGRVWGVRALATHAGVALGTASQVLRALTSSGAVRFEQSGRSARVWLDDPAGLLRLWFAAYTWERNERVAFHAPVGDPARFVRRLPELLKDTRWALTLQAGASLVAPHATWDRVHAYVGAASRAELIHIGRARGWTPAEDGPLVLMKPYYKTSVWEGVKLAGTVPVVDQLQLALDLWHYPLRGREAAEHVLRRAVHIELP